MKTWFLPYPLIKIGYAVEIPHDQPRSCHGCAYVLKLRKHNTPFVLISSTINKRAFKAMTHYRVNIQMDELAANERQFYIYFLEFSGYYNPTSLVESYVMRDTPRRTDSLVKGTYSLPLYFCLQEAKQAYVVVSDKAGHFSLLIGLV